MGNALRQWLSKVPVHHTVEFCQLARRVDQCSWVNPEPVERRAVSVLRLPWRS